MESTRQGFQSTLQKMTCNAKNQTRQLLAFPWRGPNVQAKCTVMKAATSISEKEAAHSLAKHAILPIRTFVSYSEEISTLHGSTSSQKYSTAMYNWNQKYSCLKDLNRLSLDVEQYYTSRTPPEAPALQDCASTMGYQVVLWTDTREDPMVRWTQGLGITSGSGGYPKGVLETNCTFPLSHTVV